MKTQQEPKSLVDISDAYQQEDNDHIVIISEWFNAQQLVSSHPEVNLNLKRLIGDWGGVDISQAEIIAVVNNHDKFHGNYPHYNINPQLTFPSSERLRRKKKLIINPLKEQYMLENYRFYENINYSSADGHTVVASYTRIELPTAKNDDRDYCEKNDCECYYCFYGR